jgi:hypothetical protein
VNGMTCLLLEEPLEILLRTGLQSTLILYDQFHWRAHPPTKVFSFIVLGTYDGMFWLRSVKSWVRRGNTSEATETTHPPTVLLNPGKG